MKLFKEEKKSLPDRIADWIQNWLNERYLNKKVTLIMLTFDEVRQEYTMEYVIRKRRDLPKDAVHVVKKRNCYFADFTHHEPIPIVDHATCTAVDVNLFMENNSIRDALLMAHTRQEPLDMRKVLTYGIIAIVGAIIVFTIMG